MKIASNVDCHEETANTEEGNSKNQGKETVKTDGATWFIDSCSYPQEGDQYCDTTDPYQTPIYDQFYRLDTRLIGESPILYKRILLKIPDIGLCLKSLSQVDGGGWS